MTTPTPKKKLPLWQKLLIGAGTCFVALVILGLIVGPEKKTDTAAPTGTTTAAAPTTSTPPTSATAATTAATTAPPAAAAPATEAAPPQPAMSADQQVATAAETYVKENFGMTPDASWQGNCYAPPATRDFTEGGPAVPAVGPHTYACCPPISTTWRCTDIRRTLDQA